MSRSDFCGPPDQRLAAIFETKAAGLPPINASARLIGWSGGPIQHDWRCESQPDEAILSPLYDRRYEYPTLKSNVNVRSGSKSGRTVSHGAAF